MANTKKFKCPKCGRSTGVIILDPQNLQGGNSVSCTDCQCGWSCPIDDIPQKTGCKDLYNFLQKYKI